MLAVVAAGRELGCEWTHAEFRVLVNLVEHANRKTGQLNPSVARLADECHMQPQNVRRALRGLEEKKAIRRPTVSKGGRRGNKGLSQVYELTLVTHSSGAGKPAHGESSRGSSGFKKGLTMSPEPGIEPVTEPPPPHPPPRGDARPPADTTDQRGGGGQNPEKDVAQNGGDAPPCAMCAEPLKAYRFRAEGVHPWCVAKLRDRGEYKLLSESMLDGALDLAERWLRSLGAEEWEDQAVWIVPPWLANVIANDPWFAGQLEHEPGGDERWFYMEIPDRLWAKHRHIKHPPEGA